MAIVGTREVSGAGITRTKGLAREPVEIGINIVSGLAYGVDTVAHTTAIENGGKTIAVIGTPLEKASPSENAKLQECIYREHLVISRFKKGEKIFRTNFPLRNRLMAIGCHGCYGSNGYVRHPSSSGRMHEVGPLVVHRKISCR